MREKVQNVTSGTIYYDDKYISYHAKGTIKTIGNQKYLEVIVPYAMSKMKDNGKNYWYVIAKNAKGTTRYPTSGNMSFTVKGTTPINPM